MNSPAAGKHLATFGQVAALGNVPVIGNVPVLGNVPLIGNVPVLGNVPLIGKLFEDRGEILDDRGEILENGAHNCLSKPCPDPAHPSPTRRALANVVLTPASAALDVPAPPSHK